jgi:predicted glycosyltransferase
VVPFFRWLAYPLAHAIVTPRCLAHERWGARHRTYAGYHALFYLHPRRFTPDPRVREELGLPADARFALVRLSALEAHHDANARGLSPEFLDTLLSRLAGAGLAVVVSSEKPLQSRWAAHGIRVAPERIHHALAAAALYVGDSQTMTAEAAVLGTPALRLNDFVGRISYLRELEEHGLAFGFRVGEEQRLLEAVGHVLSEPSAKAIFAERRARMLASCIDPLPWLVDVYEEIGRLPR